MMRKLSSLMSALACAIERASGYALADERTQRCARETEAIDEASTKPLKPYDERTS